MSILPFILLLLFGITLPAILKKILKPLIVDFLADSVLELALVTKEGKS